MKIFVAGATGAIGKRLVPLLVSRGHQVVATTRTAAKAEMLRDLGAETRILDGLDSDAVMKAVMSSRPDAIVHEMTALASMRSLKNFDKEFALTNRLRTEGTEHLIGAAQAAGTRKLIVQSYSGWSNSRSGGRIKTEDDPLDPEPPKAMSETLAAIRKLEEITVNATGVTGIVLRYGSLYGPGTSISPSGEIVQVVRRRKFPVIGGGAGVWSFIHVDDAAAATRLAVEGNAQGVYNVVDDEPAEVSVWLPELAKTAGARPPLRLPAWVGRLAMGESGVSMMTEVRGSSNAKAKRTFGWKPIYSSWRDGFGQVLGAAERSGLNARSAAAK
jgi:nucleoside-diphosphate-sugar epimerase